MSEQRTITLPNGISKKANDLGINVSKTAAIAVQHAIEKLEEKDVAGSPSKANTRNSTPVREAQ